MKTAGYQICIYNREIQSSGLTVTALFAIHEGSHCCNDLGALYLRVSVCVTHKTGADPTSDGA